VFGPRDCVAGPPFGREGTARHDARLVDR